MGISGTLTSGAGVADSLGVGGVTQPIRSVTISRVATMDEVVMDFDEFIGCLVAVAPLFCPGSPSPRTPSESPLGRGREDEVGRGDCW